jgi:hypothetical protein
VTIHEALIEIMKAVPAVPKSDRNEAQRFDFRGIDSVLNAVGPKLRDHGVIVYPQVTEHHAREVSTSKGTKMNAVTLLVQYTFVDKGGDSLTVEVPGEAMDAGDKAYSKAMSVAFRTALLQTLALPTDEKDPDADAYERAGPGTLTDIEQAQAELLAKVATLKLNTKDVARLYRADMGLTIQEETDPQRMRDFTKRLDVNVFKKDAK